MNKNIRENSAQKLINRTFRPQNKQVIIPIWLVKKCLCAWILGATIKLHKILFLIHFSSPQKYEEFN